MPPTTCCNGTYVRDADGTWRYEWGEPVPAARDLTLRSVLAARDPERFGSGRPPPAARTEDVAWARSLCDISEPIELQRPDGSRDLVIGISAPELEVPIMMTVADIADVAEVSKATVDSYRYRGYLPEPQLVKGRTPLWSWPVVHHWLQNRPGSGWRTDVYGCRESFAPERALPITSARQARDRRLVEVATRRSANGSAEPQRRRA